MAASLSAYWVKFFKGAGFPQDVATKHAVVFSNNRIKPDMLPDLDKPSLKEMGITLMGDMIAILRYAKKVVEETTCERFLVDSEDSVHTPKLIPKPAVKKIVPKVLGKAMISAKMKDESIANVKPAKPTLISSEKRVTIKKPLSTIKSTIPALNDQKRKISIKRKLEHEEEIKISNNDDWNEVTSKKLKTKLDAVDDKVGYTIILPKGATARSKQITKINTEQKRTVFDRLGDSSVTSTTNLADTSPTFNITGLGKDVLKRSVFNRLGDKDTRKDDAKPPTILKNGNTVSQGILKKWNTSKETSNTVTKKVVCIGTMHADLEANKKITGIKQLVNTSKKISFNDQQSPSSTKIIKPEVTCGKLASERLTTISAKARLGVTSTSGPKQVTFNRIATVTHVRKPDVFSRLGL